MPQNLQSRLRRAPSKPHLALWRAKQTANLNLWKSHGYYFRRLQFQSRFGVPHFEKKGKSQSFFNNSYFPQGAPEASGRARPARPRASLVQFEGFFLSFFNTFVFVEKVKKMTRRLTAVAAKAGFALHFLLYYLLYIIAIIWISLLECFWIVTISRATAKAGLPYVLSFRRASRPWLWLGKKWWFWRRYFLIQNTTPHIVRGGGVF